MLGLGAVEADGLNESGQLLLPEREDGLWRVGHWKEPGGGQVDRLVGGLGREHHGNEQFERAAVGQLRLGVGDGMRQPLEDEQPFARIHAAPPGMACRRRAALASAASSKAR